MKLLMNRESSIRLNSIAHTIILSVRKFLNLLAFWGLHSNYVLVGGGTAGCVLAARLSENPSINVLVLEAGGEETDYWYSHIPALMGKLQRTPFDWAFLTEPQTHCCDSFKNKVTIWLGLFANALKIFLAKSIDEGERLRRMQHAQYYESRSG